MLSLVLCCLASGRPEHGVNRLCRRLEGRQGSGAGADGGRSASGEAKGWTAEMASCLCDQGAGRIEKRAKVLPLHQARLGVYVLDLHPLAL